MYANSSQFVKQILSLDAPKRQYKRKEAGPDDEKTRVRITLLEYGNKSLIGPSFGITAMKKSDCQVVVEDELAAEVSKLVSCLFFEFFWAFAKKVTGKKICLYISGIGYWIIFSNIFSIKKGTQRFLLYVDIVGLKLDLLKSSSLFVKHFSLHLTFERLRDKLRRLHAIPLYKMLESIDSSDLLEYFMEQLFVF